MALVSTDVLSRPLLTIRQAAEVLGVSERTVRRRIASGELLAVQLGQPGTAVRVDADELERFVFGQAS